jgi:hypothetical protein
MQAICRRVIRQPLPLRRSERNPRTVAILEVIINGMIVPIDLNAAFRQFFPTIHPHRHRILSLTMPTEVTVEEYRKGKRTAYRIVHHDLLYWFEKVRTYPH